MRLGEGALQATILRRAFRVVGKEQVRNNGEGTALRRKEGRKEGRKHGTDNVRKERPQGADRCSREGRSLHGLAPWRAGAVSKTKFESLKLVVVYWYMFVHSTTVCTVELRVDQSHAY
jgi:hypothetical protein